MNAATSSAGAWAPYVPEGRSPWNLRRVVHLHRRAGFAASWSEIQRDLKEGHEASINRLLAGKMQGEKEIADFARVADELGEAVGLNDPARLKAWWVYRMLFGPDPLGERLTLMWHNHFATSNLKVENIPAMRRQNELFRRYVRAPFGEMLAAVMRDPALLVWLDAPANRKGHPNENLARELMELFTLGIGNYTEADVKEAARALTGWTVVEDAFAERVESHDPGAKTIFGRKGAWKGDDLIRMTREHPATADRLAGRLCELFLNEKCLRNADVADLAAGLRRRDLDIGWAVETILRSQTFFADDNLGGRILSPVEYVIGAAHCLELIEPATSTLVLAEWITRLGQDLFYPPNVGGWPGGRAWLTTRALLGRANFAAALVAGLPGGRPIPLDALGLAGRHGQEQDIPAFFTRLILGMEPSAEWQARLTAAVGRKNGEENDAARRVVVMILATPEAQLS